MREHHPVGQFIAGLINAIVRRQTDHNVITGQLSDFSSLIGQHDSSNLAIVETVCNALASLGRAIYCWTDKCDRKAADGSQCHNMIVVRLFFIDWSAQQFKFHNCGQCDGHQGDGHRASSPTTPNTKTRNNNGSC